MVKKLINHSRESKSKDIWLYIKQVWYMPFIWSLAWFSYWIFHDVIVYNHSIFQLSTLNYFGVAISISALLIAGYVYGRSHKKQVEKTAEAGIKAKNLFVFRKAFVKKSSQESLLPQENMHKIQGTKLEQLAPKLKNHSPIETSQTQKPNAVASESTQTPSIIGTSPSQVNLTNQTKKSQEIPSDCLICHKLAKCDQRQKRTNKMGIPCPYAKSDSP